MITSVFSAPSVDSNLFQTLNEDLISFIFKKTLPPNIEENRHHIRLVCKKWQRIIDSSKIGQWIFDLLGWNFPNKKPESWRTYFNTADCHIRGKPEKKVFSYPWELDLRKHKVHWIGNRGFVAYIKNTKEFTFHMFGSPDKFSTITCESPICSILAMDDLIICGMKNGCVSGYSLGESRFAFKETVHGSSVCYLFPYLGGKWVSVCSKNIVRWNGNSSTVLLSSYCPSSGDDTIISCFLEHKTLFLKYMNFAISADRFVCYSLSLETPGEGLQKIQSPPISQHPKSHASVWGGQMGGLKVSLAALVVEQSLFDHEYFFSQTPTEWVTTTTITRPTLFTKWRFFFRGHMTLLFGTELRSRGKQWFIYVIDSYLNKITLWEDNSFMGEMGLALVGNQLISISPKTREIHILEFSSPHQGIVKHA